MIELPLLPTKGKRKKVLRIKLDLLFYNTLYIIRIILKYILNEYNFF